MPGSANRAVTLDWSRIQTSGRRLLIWFGFLCQSKLFIRRCPGGRLVNQFMNTKRSPEYLYHRRDTHYRRDDYSQSHEVTKGEGRVRDGEDAATIEGG